MADKNPTVEEPEATTTEAEKQAERNAELKAEIKALENERLADESREIESSKLAQLNAEEARLLTELEYQRRLKAARTGNSDATDTQDGNGAPSVVPVVPPQVADNAEGNPSADKAEPAKASTGKGK